METSNPSVVFGPGRRYELGAQLDAVGASSVLVVGGGHEESAIDELVATLPTAAIARIRGVHQHVPLADVEAAVAIVDAEVVDTVVTVGGGSATGLGKAVTLERAVRLVSVPTTYAGSEMTSIWGVSDGDRKRTGRDPRVLPSLVIYDPELTLTLPRAITASSSFNALAHCVESLWVPEADSTTTAAALEAIGGIVEALPATIAEPGDVDARGWLLYGAHRAGGLLDRTGTALHHRASHVLGGRFGLDHAGMNSALLPHVVAYNSGWGTWDLSGLEAVLGTSPAARLFDLARSVGAPTSLVELGMPEAGIDDVIEEIIGEVRDRNPRTPDRVSLGEMLHDAWWGQVPPRSR